MQEAERQTGNPKTVELLGPSLDREHIALQEGQEPGLCAGAGAEAESDGYLEFCDFNKALSLSVQLAHVALKPEFLLHLVAHSIN